VFFLNYETKFLISLIFKKISKYNLKKNVNFDKKKKKETKNVRQKKKENKKKKYTRKANLYQAYHLDLIHNQHSLFDIRNRYNIIITMWKKPKRSCGGMEKKQKVAWGKLRWFPHPLQSSFNNSSFKRFLKKIY